MRLAWLTDLHLEFLHPPGKIEPFCRSVARKRPDGVLIGGDTGTAVDLGDILQRIERCFECPIWFVLGNHDFYGGSIAGVRALAARLHRDSARLRWLVAAGVVELSPRTALIGHDGWADGRLGNGSRSRVVLNDYELIAELSHRPVDDLFRTLGRLGDDAATQVRAVLSTAVARYEQIVFLTHAPPFREACWHAGRISDDEYRPHFTCRAVGDALLEVMGSCPTARLTVLCGHTHGEGIARPAPNILVRTGGARYGRPRLIDLIPVD